jgi:hypothetical protein
MSGSKRKIAEILAAKPGPPKGLFGTVKPMSDQERTLRAQIANGGQSLGRVPTALDVVNSGSPYAKPGAYSTTLSPSQEAAFQQWKAINAPNDSGQDYDLRGAFLANEGRAGNGHMTDQFKMPNHQSFSNESQYATPDAPHWNAQDQLVDKYGNIVFDERNMPRNIGEGGQSLGMTFRDPTAGIIEADPFQMATGMPLTDGNENYDQLTRTALGGVQGMATPAYLQEGYQGPQTGMGPVGDFAAGMGQVFQGGSGAGTMGAPALLASQAVNNAADAGHALGTMGGGKVPKALSDAEEIAKIRARMRMFEDMPPVKGMTPEQAARLRAEAEAYRLANPPDPNAYAVPPMEDFLPKKPKGKK